MGLFKQSKEEKADQYLNKEQDRIGLDSDVKSHLIELQCSLDERGQRALACLLETATKNKYSGDCILGGWLIEFNNGLVSIEKPTDPYQ